MLAVNFPVAIKGEESSARLPVPVETLVLVMAIVKLSELESRSASMMVPVKSNFNGLVSSDTIRVENPNVTFTSVAYSVDPTLLKPVTTSTESMYFHPAGKPMLKEVAPMSKCLVPVTGDALVPKAVSINLSVAGLPCESKP